MNKILIVEDEEKLRDIMRRYLEKEGFRVICACDGEEGEKIIESHEELSLIVLDVMMPKKDGWSLLRRIKKIKKEVPVIIITARGEEEDRIFGLELGADDYMVKPISMREFILRVKLRMNAKKGEEFFSFHGEGFEVDENSRMVKEFDENISLTPKEFELMLYFLKNNNIVFNREKLLDKVWGYDFFGDSRTVDSHVKNLREKLEYFNAHLKTVWGVGYKLERSKNE